MTAEYSITAYGLCAALAAAAFIATTYIVFKPILKRKTDLLPGLFAVIIPCGLIGARAAYCAAKWDEWQGVVNALCVWKGGLSLAGAIGFSALAARIYLGSGKAFSLYADRLTPGAMLFIAIMRLAEGTTGEGVGKCVDTEFLRGGPFVMLDGYGDFRHAVYRIEALVAVALCVFAIWLIVRRVRRQRTSSLTWTLFFAAQVLLESLRDDDYLKWEYVRLSQVAYFLALLVLSGVYLTKGYKAAKRLGEIKRWALLPPLCVLGAILTVFQEFRVDTDVNLELNYLIMALGLAAIAVCAFRCDALREARYKRRFD